MERNVSTLQKVCKKESDKLHAAMKEEKRLAGLIKPLEESRSAALGSAAHALGEIILEVVRRYGEFTEHKGMFHRTMCCFTQGEHLGFVDIIDRQIKKFDFSTMYRPALESLNCKKIYYCTGMGDCFVILIEKLTQEEVAKIIATRNPRMPSRRSK